MNFGGIAKTVGKKFMEHLPDILLGLGIGGGVTTTVLACKRTLKLNGVLDDINDDINELHSKREVYSEEEYSKKEYVKDITKTYTKSACKIVNLYKTPIVVGTLSLASVVVGRNVQSSRFHEQAAKLSASIAAGNAAMLSFSNYRANVRDEYGPEVDKRLRFNLKEDTIETPVFDKNGEPKVDKDGVVKTKKETIMYAAGPFNVEDSVVLFSAETSTEYELNNPEYNEYFIACVQDEYNNSFSYRRPYIFLNDVLRRLGLKPTKAGQVIGWEWAPEKRIEFDIEKIRNTETGRIEYVISFNVDPCILAEKL